MGLGSFSTDTLEQQLTADEATISAARARQMAILEELDLRQVAAGDGCRSLAEWVSGRLDIGTDSAKTLVRTMRRLQERPDLQEDLASGAVTFDRVEAVSRIADPTIGLMWFSDISGVRREAARRIRISAEDESRSVQDNYMVMQPTLDESRWRFWGDLDGFSGGIVDKALTEAADALPDLPDGTRGTSSWRRATALVQCLTCDDPPPGQVTVIVDAREAADTSAESGVVLEAGARVGQRALGAILCDATTEVVARTEDGRLMDYGRRQRTAPPALKRALIAKHRYRCAADGCDSRNRLQVHHLTPWSRGGETNQDELIVLCWFHHQVVVHQRGFDIYRHPGHGRIRFRRPPPRPGPP